MTTPSNTIQYNTIYWVRDFLSDDNGKENVEILLVGNAGYFLITMEDLALYYVEYNGSCIVMTEENFWSYIILGILDFA